MHTLLWYCRAFIFLFLLAFALKNTEPVNIRFFFDVSRPAPLIIVAFAFFAAGMLLGVLALCGKVFRLKREVSRLKRASRASEGKEEIMDTTGLE
ncbi:MAG: lipopolysaccharide assembly protein LapA domain-containing protein [Candidatus Accumulibacter sp.]|jgi:uncharacterized integral membrane protein|nr:lipopolysaccharide assembly protein LapA domain-containing protein [Accumulibacter sp.]